MSAKFRSYIFETFVSSVLFVVNKYIRVKRYIHRET